MTDAARRRVIDEAHNWLGTPYRHQASRKGIGCDCLGLVRGVWRDLYGREPESVGPYSPDWAEAGPGEPLLDGVRRHFIERQDGAITPGNLLVFRWRPALVAKHLGICVENNRFIHAYEGRAVVASALVPQWRKRVAGVFDFPRIPDLF